MALLLESRHRGGRELGFTSQMRRMHTAGGKEDGVFRRFVRMDHLYI